MRPYELAKQQGEKRAERKPQKLPDARLVRRSLARAASDFFLLLLPEIRVPTANASCTSRARVEQNGKTLKKLGMDYSALARECEFFSEIRKAAGSFLNSAKAVADLDFLGGPVEKKPASIFNDAGLGFDSLVTENAGS